MLTQQLRLGFFVLVVVAASGMAACGSRSAGADERNAASPGSTVAVIDGVSDDDGHDQEHGAGSSRLRQWVGSPAPTVHLALEAASEPPTLIIEADGFTFTSAAVTDPVPGEGHAHLYVNGELLTMIYEPEFELSVLPAGDHELTVTLSTNDHLEYSLGGEPIGSTLTVAIGREPADGELGTQQDENEPPIVLDSTVIETIHGVVVAVDGDLTRTRSFTVILESGERVVFFPTAEATFHGGPIAHIRDHLVSGVPVVVDYALLEDGTHAAIAASDH